MKAVEKRVVPPEAVTIFTRRLSAAMRFGVPLAQAIEICSEDVKSARLRQAIRRVRDLITKGTPLSEALSKESRFFPPFYIAAISQAEKTEDVPSALRHLAEELDELATTRNLVMRLERYPVVVAFLTVLIALSSVLILLPAVLVPARGFKEVWDGWDTTLPATGWGFFWIVGTFLADHGLTIVLALCGIAALVSLDSLLLRLFPRGKLVTERGKLGLPLYGRSIRNINLLIFCDTLGRSLKHGFSLSQALAAAQKAVPTEVFRREIARLAGDVRRGSTLSQAIRKSEWFPLALTQALAAGESRSQVPQAFLDMASSFRTEGADGVRRIGRWTQAWVASLAGASVLFCVASFLVTIATFLLSTYHG